MAVGSWGYFMQGGNDTRIIDNAGAELSKQLDCPVHYPAFGKRLFECRHGVVFPAFTVEHAVESGNWEQVRRHHETGYRPQEPAF